MFVWALRDFGGKGFEEFTEPLFFASLEVEVHDDKFDYLISWEVFLNEILLDAVVDL